jgi:hypothetical protein
MLQTQQRLVCSIYMSAYYHMYPRTTIYIYIRATMCVRIYHSYVYYVCVLILLCMRTRSMCPHVCPVACAERDAPDATATQCADVCWRMLTYADDCYTRRRWARCSRPNNNSVCTLNTSKQWSSSATKHSRLPSFCGTDFTRFTSSKVQMLTPEELQAPASKSNRHSHNRKRRCVFLCVCRCVCVCVCVCTIY